MKRFDLQFGIYALGIFLLIILFGFGSYVKDVKVDVLLAPQVVEIHQDVFGGIIPYDPNSPNEINEYFAEIKELENPKTFVIIDETDFITAPITVEPIITHKNGYKTIFGEVECDSEFVDKLLETDYITLASEDFYSFSASTPLVTSIKYSFKNARIVPIVLTSETASLDAYKLSRLLKKIVGESNKSVFVIAINKESPSSDPNMKELQMSTQERAFHNFDISTIKNLKTDSVLAIKTALYYFHFNQAKNPVFKNNFVYYTKEDAPEKMERVTLLGFGDVMLDRAVRSLMDKHGLNYPFQKIAGDIGGTDHVFANFEGPIKEFPVATSKSISFRFKPDVVQVVKDAGITIVSIANNHALDQGWGGRDDTKRFLEAGGVTYFGHPKNTHEENVHVSEISGSKVAFLGYDDTIFKVNVEDSAANIRQLKEENDYVIISIHWGAEYKHTPTNRKIELAHGFVDAGADLVIGHHPHVVQTMEIYNGVPVFYSLGNFVFDQYFSQDTQEGLAIGTIFEKDRTVIYLYPYAIPNSQPEFMSEGNKASFLEKFLSWGAYDESLAAQIREGKIEITR
ncbi:AmmeMemoRadiSam system protein B [Patescibacteria group bacterium]